jgi:hypothetical protein
MVEDLDLEELWEKIQTQYPSSHVQESQELGLQAASPTTLQAGSPPTTGSPSIPRSVDHAK